MLLKEEKHTSQSVAFAIEIPYISKVNAESPFIKKKLEAELSSHTQPTLTLEQINEKLKRAEEKRKNMMRSCQERGNHINRVNERKASIEL